MKKFVKTFLLIGVLTLSVQADAISLYSDNFQIAQINVTNTNGFYLVKRASGVFDHCSSDVAWVHSTQTDHGSSSMLSLLTIAFVTNRQVHIYYEYWSADNTCRVLQVALV